MFSFPFKLLPLLTLSLTSIGALSLVTHKSTISSAVSAIANDDLTAFSLTIEEDGLRPLTFELQNSLTLGSLEIAATIPASDGSITRESTHVLGSPEYYLQAVNVAGQGEADAATAVKFIDGEAKTSSATGMLEDAPTGISEECRGLLAVVIVLGIGITVAIMGALLIIIVRLIYIRSPPLTEKQRLQNLELAGII